MMHKVTTNLTLFSVCLLVLGLFPMPYGYYTLLRLCACGYAGYVFYLRYQQERFSFVNIVLILIAFLYNPIIKVGFERDVWLFINLATIFFILYCAFFYKRGKK